MVLFFVVLIIIIGVSLILLCNKCRRIDQNNVDAKPNIINAESSINDLKQGPSIKVGSAHEPNTCVRRQAPVAVDVQNNKSMRSHKKQNLNKVDKDLSKDNMSVRSIGSLTTVRD